jgi:hypothetical protein
MSATDHLKSYGVTPRLKPDGKIVLQGVGNLPGHVRAEVVTWAKGNREAILKELNPDEFNEKTKKGVEQKRLPPPRPKRRHRKKPPFVNAAMVKAWRVGRAWILDHLPELQQAGWTRAELLRAGRFQYPCGTWGAAWGDVWLKPGATVAIGEQGAIRWTWFNETGKAISQTMRPK